MPTFLQRASTAAPLWFTRQSRIGRTTLVLLAILVLALVAEDGLGLARGLDSLLIILSTLALGPLLLILLYRWITRRLLWKVRDRLILTYLLMGLAPIVLFALLAGIALYLLAGQYSTNTALSLLDENLRFVTEETVTAATSLPIATPHTIPVPGRNLQTSTEPLISVDVLSNGSWQPLSPDDGGRTPSPFDHQPAPAWLHPPFHGVVAKDQALFLCSEANVQQSTGAVLVLGCTPLTPAAIASLASGLGTLAFVPGFSRLANDPGAAASNLEEDKTSESPRRFDPVSGGLLPEPASFFDTPVLFSSPLPITAWDTGKSIPTFLVVVSRPTLLYKRLFATSVMVGAVVRTALISITILFSLLELLALLMAVGLSRTITRSVADLSLGTREIDAGNLAHRVRVQRNDQLGALATSFNGMADSISHLLVQQREKDRLLNELAIAQEVQTTLFPPSPAALPGLEMHAVCLPAQTIGGDYFDFIFGPHNAVCLALGDISGKGISAALLMASLHSAVRAFSLEAGGSGAPLLSPAILLGDINRHLLRSTQSSRYATLFVAAYNAQTQVLTYANGGHLPPLVISTDGSIRRLECGGSVVGLLDGMAYAEAQVPLRQGDLLVAFTDGVTEPENGALEFGEQRLIDTIRRHQILPLPDIMAATLQAVQQWIGNREQPDDITLLLARQL